MSTDAIWFALGADRDGILRLSKNDKKHAIELALKTWPERSQHKIADQIGCSQQFVSRVRAQVTTGCHLPDRVTGRDGKSYRARTDGRS